MKQHISVSIDFGDLKIFIQEHMESDKYNVEVLRHWSIFAGFAHWTCDELSLSVYIEVSQFTESFLFSEEAESCDKASSVFLDTLLTCGLNRFNGLTIPTKQVREDFERIFGLELYDKAMTVMAEAVQATSIKRCFEVACRLYDLAVDAFNETNEQEEPPQDDNQGADYGDSKAMTVRQSRASHPTVLTKMGMARLPSSGGNGGSPSSSAGQNGPSSDPDGNTGGAPDKEHGQNDSDDETIIIVNVKLIVILPLPTLVTPNGASPTGLKCFGWSFLSLICRGRKTLSKEPHRMTWPYWTEHFR